MKFFGLLLPALMAGSMAFAQAPAAGGAMAGGDMAPAKSMKEAKKACKEQAAGDKKAFKKCMKDWKKGQK